MSQVRSSQDLAQLMALKIRTTLSPSHKTIAPTQCDCKPMIKNCLKCCSVYTEKAAKKNK